MLTRKDYKAIAAILANQRDTQIGLGNLGIPLEVVADVASDLADYMAQDNPNFDEQKFLDASYRGK